MYRHIIDTFDGVKLKLTKETIDLFEKSLRMQELNFKIYNNINKNIHTIWHILRKFRLLMKLVD
jgi:hypothetical protein